MKKILVFASIVMLCASAWANYLSLFIQNDVFLPNKSDKYYSHGTRIEYGADNLGYSIGQYMYTPSDITVTNVLYGDRPYCGWLYGSIFKEITRSEGILDYFELQLGAVGDYSYCEKTQKFIHKNINSREPKGWNNQIENEFCANLYVLEKYPFEIFPSSFHLAPQAGVSFGNFYCGANIGIVASLGYKIPSELTPKSIEPTIMKLKNPIRYLYAFSKINGRYVAHNITIEGSMFSDDSPYTTEPEKYVLDVEYGLCLGIKNYDVKLSVVDKSDEIVGQKYDEEFGALTVSFVF